MYTQQAGLLPFESLEGGSSYPYRERDARLMVITAPEDTAAEPFITPQGMEKVAQTDYATHMVIIVFQGWKSRSPYSVSVDRISYDGAYEIRIEATFHEPTQMLQMMETSPYQVVRVAKPKVDADVEVDFILIANGREIVRLQRKMSQ